MTRCEQCEKEDAVTYCLVCERWYCVTCFIFQHIGYYVNKKAHQTVGKGKQQMHTWEDVQARATQLEVSFTHDGDEWIILKKHQGVSGSFQNSEAGIKAALIWLEKLNTIQNIADTFRK